MTEVTKRTTRRKRREQHQQHDWYSLLTAKEFGSRDQCIDITMGRNSRATRAATSAWAVRSAKGSETGGIRVDNTTDNREEDIADNEVKSGSGSSIPDTQIMEQADDMTTGDMGETTYDSFQTAREEATIHRRYQIARGNGELRHPRSAWRRR